MNDLSIRTGQCQLAKRRFMFHEACIFALQQSSSRATVKPRLFIGASGQNTVHSGVALQFFKRANGGKDNEEVPCCMTTQRCSWADPYRLKLFFFVRDRYLSLGHTRHQKRHIKSSRQITVGYPVCQNVHLIGRQYQTMRMALLSKVILPR